ncbi:hypothetical protein SAMN02745163_02456 [Clostridium cavendishii DSM 21758]|uniref:Uncharacterized protein n=1 Tax=Clostridium cavendishii DSM 21758 TaxID=1121302 RepID=A0A1M6LQA1_9CLOT|nr:hypothetical protein [Clostridium cavendishii]SHJ73373.1 hypothetical protein SAMN02745163_02456 [Clostridium cavendishii DSM 21758]
MLNINSFIKNAKETTDYTCYNINHPITILNKYIDDIDDLEINISNGAKLDLLLDSINRYFIFLNRCENVLKTYYKNELIKR